MSTWKISACPILTNTIGQSTIFSYTDFCLRAKTFLVLSIICFLLVSDELTNKLLPGTFFFFFYMHTVLIRQNNEKIHAVHQRIFNVSNHTDRGYLQKEKKQNKTV